MFSCFPSFHPTKPTCLHGGFILACHRLSHSSPQPLPGAKESPAHPTRRWRVRVLEDPPKMASATKRVASKRHTRIAGLPSLRAKLHLSLLVLELCHLSGTGRCQFCLLGLVWVCQNSSNSDSLEMLGGLPILPLLVVVNISAAASFRGNMGSPESSMKTTLFGRSSLGTDPIWGPIYPGSA